MPVIRPPLTIYQILHWADCHYERTGDWPLASSGPIIEAPGENWDKVNMSLLMGRRGLPGGSSLPRLLARHRGRPTRSTLTRLTYRQILAWADACHLRTGRWPSANGEFVAGPGSLTWGGLNTALRLGIRGLPGGSSVHQLLQKYRNASRTIERSPLTVRRILHWADAYFDRTGRWPHARAGAIPGAGGDTWSDINRALVVGHRGLPGGSSLARLLSVRTGRRPVADRPRLTYKLIISWAWMHKRRTGRWPSKKSGPVLDAPGETWPGLNAALKAGARGLPAGLSLAGLLVKRRCRRDIPPGPLRLSVHLVLRWADQYYQRTGQWPTRDAGAVSGRSELTWMTLDEYLTRGLHGLPAGRTLAQLLAQKRGQRNRWRLPPLSVKQILAWADAYYESTGRWPDRRSGPVAGVLGETWLAINWALRHANRGLRGPTSLARVLARHRGVTRRVRLAYYPRDQIGRPFP